MNRIVDVAGIDLAFSKTGVCIATVDLLELKVIKVRQLALVKTTVEEENKKVVRKNSLDFARARHLRDNILRLTEGCSFVFAEIPHGSQSARSSWTLGIAIGVLTNIHIPVVELSATEVKVALTGKKTASKDLMIATAHSHHPDAQWLKYKRKGQVLLADDNEHLADAYGTVLAGLNTTFMHSIKSCITIHPKRKRVVIHD